MRSPAAAAFAMLSFASVLSAGWNPFAPKVTFTRRIPAPNNLGPLKTLCLVEIRGGDSVEFSRHFKNRVSTDAVFTLDDATASGVPMSRLTGDAREAIDFRKEHSADVYMGVNLGGCSSNLQSAARTVKQKDKSTITKTYYWYTAICTATARLVDGKDGRELASFSATGDAKSAESEKMYGFESTSTEGSARQDLVGKVAAQFTPRLDKESVVLDKKAPQFKPAMERIKTSELTEARRIWEEALPSNSQSGGLTFNLAAVSEALGDADAARKYYTDAMNLSPTEKRFSLELAKFEQRERDKAALLVRP